MNTENPVVARMQSLIDRWEAANDRRVIFLSCYAMMTRNMLAAIDRKSFEDPGWVRALLERFAEYYFNALEAYEQCQNQSPVIWQLAFEAANRPQVHVLQNLILGVNAHINYDLVFALADLLRPDWSRLLPEQRKARYRDHCRVNDTIAQTIDSAQDQIVERYSPAMNLVDQMLGRLDEWLISRLIATWREEVWERAARLVELTELADQQALLQLVEQRAVQRAHSLLGEEGIRGLFKLV